MKNMRLLKGITLISILLSSFSVANATTFSDISENNRNLTAIEYLAEVGIISGYTDGSFKPGNTVNRVEFLKLVLESSDIETNVGTTTNFSDINESAWYAKYVRKAKNEGWVEGYPDGTFKPEQGINKVEALKIIGEVQQWKLELTLDQKPFNDTALSAWYTPYIAYAKDKNFLEENRTNYIPDTIFSREKISELLFRSYITRKSGENEFSTQLITKYPASLYATEKTSSEQINENQEPSTFTPVTYKSYPSDFFENITLSTEIPNTFYKNEVYYIEGTINRGSYDTAFVFLSPQNANNEDEYINYISELSSESFSIPVIFRKSGNYKLGLIPGETGESNIINISVLDSLPNVPNTPNNSTPSSPIIKFENNKTTFSWGNNGSELIKLLITQDTKTKTFYFRQNKKNFTIDYSDFDNFSNGKTYYSIEGAALESSTPLQINSNWESSRKKTFTSTKHHYSSIENDSITINNFPEALANEQEISFSGTTKADIYREAPVFKIGGLVEYIELNSSNIVEDSYGTEIIPKGSTFTFNYTPSTNETYIIEINNSEGSAVLNAPVYIGAEIPLTPDYFDINKYTPPIGQINLTNARNEFLELINTDREKLSLSPVNLDNSLNALAQAHSDDMVNRDFFSHINPDGESPNDRRKNAGITTTVGENLAISPTITYTHMGLMQSGTHRNNIFDPQWTKVGIGISINDYGSLVTTQEFSTDPLSDNQLSSIKTTMLNEINLKRSENNLSRLSIGSDIQNIAETWSSNMAQEEFFDFTSPNGESLSELVNEQITQKAVQALILESSDGNKLISETLNNNEIIDSEWTKIGIGLDVDNIGNIKATLLFTTH